MTFLSAVYEFVKIYFGVLIKVGSLRQLFIMGRSKESKITDLALKAPRSIDEKSLSDSSNDFKSRTKYRLIFATIKTKL